jgi:glutamine synthetase
MVGARDSVAASTIVLNTIVAEAFSEACDILEKEENFDLAVHDLIKKYAAEHQRIIFSGNGYSQEWVEEAKRRGLPNIRTMVEAIPHLVTDKTVQLFEKFGVFTKTELESRAEINYETYAKAINIEARAMIDIASKLIVPAVIKYITSLATSINQVKEACGDVCVEVQTELLAESSALLKEAKDALKLLTEKVDAVAEMPHGKAKAEFFLYEVVPVMEALRAPIDQLEMIVNKEMWPMPSYGDLLFEV